MILLINEPFREVLSFRVYMMAFFFFLLKLLVKVYCVC